MSVLKSNSFIVILICRHSITTISNIVIFSCVMTCNYIFQDDLEKGQIFMKEHMYSRQFYIGMDKLVGTPASTALFACGCVQVIPAYPPGGDTSAGSFGNGRFLISTSFTNSRFVRCTRASLPCHFRIYKIGCLR